MQSSSSGLVLISPENGRVLETLPLIDADERHRGFILSTWIKSYEATARKLVAFGMRIHADDYRNGESRVAEAKWKHTKVLTSKEDSYSIHAWCCGLPGTLYHVYVPPSLRGCGVAKALVELVSGKEYSVTKPWPERIPRGHVVRYNPWGVL